MTRVACAAAILSLLAAPAWARSILLVGNSFTFGEFSAAKRYQTDTVTLSPKTRPPCLRSKHLAQSGAVGGGLRIFTHADDSPAANRPRSMGAAVETGSGPHHFTPDLAAGLWLSGGASTAATANRIAQMAKNAAAARAAQCRSSGSGPRNFRRACSSALS